VPTSPRCRRRRARARLQLRIPSQRKAWVDRLAIAGKTFRYTDTGPVGLAGGKRVIVVIARGGHYGAGTPSASFEHAERYLRSVFGFFGITELEVVAAEGLAAGPESRAAGIARAEAVIAALGADRERVLEPA
jgi:FMN-dependent NADH-azoreductase